MPSDSLLRRISPSGSASGGAGGINPGARLQPDLAGLLPHRQAQRDPDARFTLDDRHRLARLWAPPLGEKKTAGVSRRSSVSTQGRRRSCPPVTTPDDARSVLQDPARSATLADHPRVADHHQPRRAQPHPRRRPPLRPQQHLRRRRREPREPLGGRRSSPRRSTSSAGSPGASTSTAEPNKELDDADSEQQQGGRGMVASPRSAPSASASTRSFAAPARTPRSASAACSTTSRRTSSRSCRRAGTGQATARRASRTPGGVGGGRARPGRPARGRRPRGGRRARHARRRPRRPRRRLPRQVAEARRCWESVGVLTMRDHGAGARVTLRCYVEDVAAPRPQRGGVRLEPPADLARFVKGSFKEHDLIEIASSSKVADADVPPLPADQDRYDLTQLSDVLGEVADGAADWSTTGPSPSRSRASATSRSTPGSRGSRSCSRPRHPLGREIARAETRAERDAARRGRRRAAAGCGTRSSPAVGGAVVLPRLVVRPLAQICQRFGEGDAGA